MTRAGDLDPLLETTLQPKTHRREVPPLIAAWRAEQRDGRSMPGWFRRWAKSQVAGYRLELVFGYLGMMFFGTTAIVAGIPVFKLSSPDPIAWAVGVGIAMVLGGVIAGIGAVRAGEEPQTRTIRIYNKIEMSGTILLFAALVPYAVVLLIYGYYYGDLGRQTIGAAITALAIRPTVRMVWLFFRPGKPKDDVPAPQGGVQ